MLKGRKVKREERRKEKKLYLRKKNNVLGWRLLNLKKNVLEGMGGGERERGNGAHEGFGLNCGREKEEEEGEEGPKKGPKTV